MCRPFFNLVLIFAFSLALAAQEAKPGNTNSVPAPAPAAQPAPPVPAQTNAQPQPAQPAPPMAGHMHAAPGEPEESVAPQPPQPPLPATTPVITLDYCQGAASATAAKTSCKKVITKAEFDRILDAAIPKSRRPAGADVPPQVKQAVAKEYLNMYVMASEAEKRGYPAKDPMAEEMLRLSRMQVLSMALNQELQEKTKPTDAEVESYYKDNPSAFVEVGLRRLYIPKPAPVTPPAPTPTGATPNPADASKPADAAKPADPEALKATAEKIRDRAATGEDLDKLEKEAFEAAGNKQTPPPTQMGNRRRGILPPDQDTQIFALNPGEVSKLFDNPGGFYLYKVESKRTLPLTEVKEEIQRKLQPEKLNDARKAITEKVKSDFNEKYFGGPVAAAGAAPAPGKSSTAPAGTAKQPSPAPKAGTAKPGSTTTHKPHTTAATATH